MLHSVEIDAARWTRGDVSFVIEALEAVGGEPVRARRVRGTVDLRFSDVKEENAYENLEISRYIRTLYMRAPWMAYYVVPSQDQLLMFIMTHGGWIEQNSATHEIYAGNDATTSLKTVIREAAVYAVEHGDDWLQIVEPWMSAVDPHYQDEIREFLAKKYNRHGGLRLTSAGWVGPED
ncbi:MAG: hypothetical protein WBG36_09365 [Ornithinimicrobium sp.]